MKKIKLSKRAVRQMVRGHARANKSIQQERRAWLTGLTMEEARRLFDELHQNAEQWQQFGGDLRALEKRRMASKIAGRRVMWRLSRKWLRLFDEQLPAPHALADFERAWRAEQRALRDARQPYRAKRG